MTPKPLLTLTAADLMSRPPLVIPEGMSLQGAAHMLAQAQVSGAPVVDPDGRCVGVLSATDFIPVVEAGKGSAPRHARRPDAFNFPWQLADAGGFPPDSVYNHMTADPVMVSPGASLGELAQHMLDAHIHRVVVVDEQRRPLGVVSSTDILAAVAQAARVRLGNPPAAGGGLRPAAEPARC
jgi:CBS domain-containing protein